MRNDPFQQTFALDSGERQVIDPAQAETGAVEITEISGNAGMTMYRTIVIENAENPNREILLDETQGSFHSQRNAILISSSLETEIVIENTSDVANVPYSVIGMEVDDGGA